MELKDINIEMGGGGMHSDACVVWWRRFVYIHELLNNCVLEKISNEAFQALWVEITFENKKNVICGILYRKHNSPECFHLYLDESIENFTYCRKDIWVISTLTL